MDNIQFAPCLFLLTPRKEPPNNGRKILFPTCLLYIRWMFHCLRGKAYNQVVYPFSHADKPKEVVFHPVNATGVRIAWSGSVHLHTALTYTASLSTTGTIMSQLDRVYPPGTTSDVLVMDNDITLSDEHDHNFTLHYIDNNPGTPTSATFSFGNIYYLEDRCGILLYAINDRFFIFFFNSVGIMDGHGIVWVYSNS